MKYIQRYIQTWLQDVRAHVEAFFLMRKMLSAMSWKTRQMTDGTDNMFSRRFRDLADQAYPPEEINADPQHIILKAYVWGLRSTTTA